MRIGSFEVSGTFPELKEPHALAILRPWIDVGNVGTMTLQYLEEKLEARELARLAVPGHYFDFTRYRPLMYYHGERREVIVPNTVISYARREGIEHDFVFLHLLEPHMFGERYVASLWRMLQELGVRRYCLLGSMYDVVPHTRPLLVSGSVSGATASEDFERAGMQTSDYEGPTTITTLVARQAQQEGIETMTSIVHIPQYTQLDEDYIGEVRLLQVLETIYGLPVDANLIQKAEQQLAELDVAVEQNPQVKSAVEELESHYDDRVMAKRQETTKPRLSPEIEKFLREMEKRFRQD
ncbi:MAG: PAC2 family protein [Chloroflexota bacterium]